MKKAVKLLALCLAIVLVTGSFAGCGKKKVELSGDTYTFWSMLYNDVSQTMSSRNEHPFYQAVEEATGIKMEFMHPASGFSDSEAFQVMLASAEMPDLIEYKWGTTGYAGGPDTAIADGIIISLNDYLEDYAPNYNNYMNGEKGEENDYLYRKSAVSDEGNYYGFRTINVGSYGCYEGIYVRKDLLDKWGFSIPQTIDDWEKVFEKAKLEGYKYPLTCTNKFLDPFGMEGFNTAWDVGKLFYLENGKVQLGPEKKAYKDYLEKMAEWMKKGYIDPDYVTNGSSHTDAFMMNETSIAANGWIGSGLGRLLPSVEELHPDWKIAACPNPVLTKGDVPHFQAIGNPAGDNTIAVTVACGEENEQRYKEAVTWCDWLYSDEALILKNFGVEGDTYTIEKDEDGTEHYAYTDKVVKNYKDIGATNITGGMYHYVLPSNHTGIGEHNDYYRGYYTYQAQKDALEVYNVHLDEARKHVLPTLSYTGDEAAQIAVISTNGKDNFAAAVSNIILGKQPIDTFDDAVEALKKAGYDDYKKIQQDAYNRYLDR